jgi:molybdopterin-containing oxidoreductase family iron-sulfur binding subunit
MILPLYGGWSELDILAKIAGKPKPKGPELVKALHLEMEESVDFDNRWNRFLRDGLKLETILPVSNGLSKDFSGKLPSNLPTPVAPDSFEIVFPADSKMDDGRYNNNGWMQELPDPITKTTWDNVAWISPKTAKQLGITQILHDGSAMDVIEIEVNGRKLEAPAFVVPGHADNSISLSLGWGRTVVGSVGKGTGVNAYLLRTTDTPYFAVGAKVRKVEGKTYKVAHTQEHFNMEGRGLVREASLEEFNKNPGFVKEMGGDEEVPPGNPSLYTHPWKFSDPQSPGVSPNQWGMAVDLNTCLGCSACVIACQAENNIPIVGKEQVANGRFMHWIRSDRYFVSGTDLQEDLGDYPSDPEMVMQPMLCQHCENAPCETVCPVNATVHSPDALNVMVYNRCIGTRYCANNCPFKVRRFNFFDYNQRPITPVKTIFGEVSGLKLGPLTKKGSPDTIKMQKNPNVTVRMRGVMEKCTFCVQRIQEARIAQKVKAGASDDVRIPPDTFMTACQQACPTEAIVFGDISNPESRVSKLKKQEKNYCLLEYLNVATRVSYLARLRNPNPKMPQAGNV